MSTPKHKPYENTKLEAVMNQATMTPRDLAKAARLSAFTISRALHWTSDKPVMRPTSIHKICKALHRTPAELGLDMYDTKINIAQAGTNPHIVWSKLPESRRPEIANFTYPKSEDEGLTIPKDIEDTEEDLAGKVLIDAAEGYAAQLLGKNPSCEAAQPKADSDRAILTYEKQMYQALVDARAQVVLAQERYDVVHRLVTILGIGEAATEKEGK